ncbi:hypothetical protein VFC49_10270 [Thermococcus sp. SY098]|uniref:hypothetical protein n=1 Tax=Thermococcus sp. SY098 TaxID=3111325 RepID=UPI002D799D86|nr:hypothetical protein [Thermococcus sp. SY098]WRS52402.1 hypothetical protein VFC49_10270 [Thermococcus sp. SY098]
MLLLLRVVYDHWPKEHPSEEELRLREIMRKNLIIENKADDILKNSIEFKRLVGNCTYTVPFSVVYRNNGTVIKYVIICPIYEGGCFPVNGTLYKVVINTKTEQVHIVPGTNNEWKTLKELTICPEVS